MRKFINELSRVEQITYIIVVKFKRLNYVIYFLFNICLFFFFLICYIFKFYKRKIAILSKKQEFAQVDLFLSNSITFKEKQKSFPQNAAIIL